VPFFRKKPTEPDQQRDLYRCVPDAQLQATLRVDNFGDAPGELMDLSARGAGVRVAFIEDPNLTADDHVEVLFGDGEGAPVCTPARVARVEQVGDAHLRYGLEFLDDGTLLPQLDGFYRRFFNRRSHGRLPMGHRHLRVTIDGEDGRCSAIFGDLSEQGLGLFVSQNAPLVLRPRQRVAFVFRLPGIRAPFRGTALVRYATKVTDRKLFGLEFDTRDTDFAPRLTELRQYVEQRAKQIADWEQGWTSE
jgi:hypothetical protein